VDVDQWISTSIDTCIGILTRDIDVCQ